jgi:YVTN family beta-propeller protein
VAVVLIPALGSAEPFTFVTTPGGDSVAVIDLASHTVVAALPVGGLPTGCAVGSSGAGLYVALGQSNTLAMIWSDREGSRLVRVPVGTGPTGVAVDTTRRRVYVANTGADTVSVVDIDQRAVVATIPVGDGPLALVAGPTRLYVSNWGAGTISVIDLDLNSVVGTIPVGTFPAGLALHNGTQRLYVANFFDDTVSVVNTATLSVLSTIPVTRRPRGLALDAAGLRLYVAGFEDGRVQAITTSTGTVALDTASGGLNPLDLMLGPGGTRLYVSHLQEADGVSVLDAVTLAPVATVDVPAGAVAFGGVLQQTLAPLAAGWPPAARALSARPAASQEVARAGPRGVSASLGADDVVISDAQFNPADWIITGNGDQNTTQQPTGGNPGAWRRMIHFGAALGTHRLIRPGTEYVPSSQGAIDRIDVSWDRRILAETLVDERFLVEQNNVVYRTVERTFFAPAWENDFRLDLVAENFDNGSGGHPDFSASGSTLRFGYTRQTTFSQTVPHGIDNFVVTVHRTPASPAGDLGFKETFLVVEEGEAPFVNVQRHGGSQGAVSVDVLTERPDGTTDQQTLSWPDGDDSDRSILLVFLDLPDGSGARTARLTLLNPTGGAGIVPSRSRMSLTVFPEEWPPVLKGLFLRLQALLGAFSPAWLLLLAVPATALAVRSRTRTRSAA